MGRTSSQRPDARRDRGGEKLSGLRAWGGLPARPITRSVMSAPLACCQRWNWRAPTAPTPSCCPKLARTQLLILDDWLRDPLSRSQTRDLLEILDDRYGRSATLLATQVPVAEWHARLPDPTLADAILDRLIHNAYRLELQGESMRKVHSPLTINSD